MYFYINILYKRPVNNVLSQTIELTKVIIHCLRQSDTGYLILDKSILYSAHYPKTSISLIQRLESEASKTYLFDMTLL